MKRLLKIGRYAPVVVEWWQSASKKEIDLDQNTVEPSKDEM